MTPPPDRLDVLGDDTARLAAVRGALLDDTPDPELDAIVREAARVLGAPIAVASLVLRRTQVFRAQFGLPGNLAVARATDRDASFCQLVVRDGATVAIEDARTSDEVPSDLVHTFGVRAYLGAPLRARGEVLGALCVIDVTPRTFDAEARAELEGLAARASARLEVLARAAEPEDAHLALDRAGLGPALEELKNVVGPLGVCTGLSRVALAELEPLERLARAERDGQVSAEALERVQGALVAARRAFDDLRESLIVAETLGHRIERTVRALDHALVGPSHDPSVDRLVDEARELAWHELKLVGGAKVDGGSAAPVRVDGRVAVRALAACFAGVARAARAAGADASSPGVRAAVRPREAGPGLTMRFAVPSEAAAETVVRELLPWLSDLPEVLCTVEGATLVVELVPAHGPARLR